jgi:hypothetical protein
MGHCNPCHPTDEIQRECAATDARKEKFKEGLELKVIQSLGLSQIAQADYPLIATLL